MILNSESAWEFRRARDVSQVAGAGHSRALRIPRARHSQAVRASDAAVMAQPFHDAEVAMGWRTPDDVGALSRRTNSSRRHCSSLVTDSSCAHGPNLLRITRLPVGRRASGLSLNDGSDRGWGMAARQVRRANRSTRVLPRPHVRVWQRRLAARGCCTEAVHTALASPGHPASGVLQCGGTDCAVLRKDLNGMPPTRARPFGSGDPRFCQGCAWRGSPTAGRAPSGGAGSRSSGP